MQYVMMLSLRTGVRTGGSLGANFFRRERGLYSNRIKNLLLLGTTKL